MNRTLKIASATLCLAALQSICAGQTPGLSAKISAQGLESLSYGGHEFLVPKIPASVALYSADGKRVALASKEGGGGLTRSYDGLTVLTQMKQERDTLDLTVTYKNTGSSEITRIDDLPFAVHFPKRPLGGGWKWGYAIKIDADGSPGICVADWGTDKMLVCVNTGSPAPDAEDADRPMVIGFEGTYAQGVNNPLYFQTTFKPGLAPGKQWTFHGSLRFAPSATPNRQIASEIYDSFLKLYPFTLNWPDRRPVGMVSLARSSMNWPKNMRGYFNDPDLDVTTPAGKVIFHDKLMKWGDGCIAELKRVGAQGMIFWDVEGQQMPHAISYLGDPRVLPREAPEMDACADEFFKKFLDAGFKTGVCIRPSRVIPNGTGGWKHQQVDDPIAEMADKIAYAKKRWGCTLIYMDTNVTWPMHDVAKDLSRGMWQGEATLIPARGMAELSRRSPGVLIFPEAGQIAYHATGGEYTEAFGTSAAVRAVYPDAVSLIANRDPDILGTWDARLKSAEAGDMVLFIGWFQNPPNTYVKGLYEEVDFLKRAPSVTATGALDVLLANADPLVRFVAVHRLGTPDAAQTTVLVNALPKESEWIIQREMILALGKSDDPQMEPVLAALAQNRASDLGEVAARLLGRFHAATPVLLAMAADPDWRFSMRALNALALSDDPAATPALLALTDSPNARIRAGDVRALGKRTGPEITAKMLVILKAETDSNTLYEACVALGRTKDPALAKPMLDFLMRTLNELHDNTLREAASDALEAITGLQFGVNEKAWQQAVKG